MSQLLLARNNLLIGRQALIITTACVVNIVIFFLILQLVSNEQKPLNRIASVNFLDFIHVREKTKIEERKVEEKKQQLLKEEEKLPPPDLPRPEIKKPVRSQAGLPRPEINIPLSINGVPYIGDSLKSGQASVKASPIAPVIATDLVPTLKIKPSYPPRALRSGVEGVVTVEFTIAVDGTVRDPNIITSNPPKIFDRSVLKAITKWKFNPEIVDGKTVERRARQDIHFKLQK